MKVAGTNNTGSSALAINNPIKEEAVSALVMLGFAAGVMLAASFWSSGQKGIAKRPPQSGGLRQGYVELQDSRYSQSERAASSATTTQLVCSCRIEAGHSGVTGP